MSSRSLVRTAGVAALTALCAIAGAVPAAADPAAPTPGAQGASPQLLATMARDLHLTADQAGQRVATDSAGSDAVDALRARLGDTYAGAWLQGGRLVVASTDAAAEPVIRAGGAEPRTVARSEGDLDDVQAALDAAAPAAARQIASWYVDPATNSVVVTTTDEGIAWSWVNNAKVDTAPVRVRRVAAEPRLLADLVGGQALLAQAGARCSIGFSARSADAGFVLTAGHCTELGGNWAGANGVRIGPVAASDFPGDDFGAIRVANTAAWTPTNEVAGSMPVTGSRVAAVGAAVCRSGSTTGLRCGVITARNATVNYGSGNIVRGLTGTTACAEPGDSGGSFVSGAQAQGFTSGGSGDCTTGGETFFQPVNEALDRYGLTLVAG
jgi:streptogrisin C